MYWWRYRVIPDLPWKHMKYLEYLEICDIENCQITYEGITTIMQDEEDNRCCLGQCKKLLTPGTGEQFRGSTCKAHMYVDRGDEYIQLPIVFERDKTCIKASSFIQWMSLIYSQSPVQTAHFHSQWFTHSYSCRDMRKQLITHESEDWHQCCFQRHRHWKPMRIWQKENSEKCQTKSMLVTDEKYWKNSLQDNWWTCCVAQNGLPKSHTWVKVKLTHKKSTCPEVKVLKYNLLQMGI